MKNQFVWALALFSLIMLSCKPASTDEATADNAADTTAAANGADTVAPVEISNNNNAATLKAGMDAFSRGDISGWLNMYADNAVYYWNYGDSLVGKAAITDYWTKRRTDVIDSITFRNQVLLPLKVNTPQGIEWPGEWVLSWSMTTAKYKTGKSMTQWIHTDYHFDANGKIDQAIMYVDRKLIEAAAK